MRRRQVLAGLGAAGALAACGQGRSDAVAAASSQRFSWNMVTTWPKNFPGLGTGAEQLADLIGAMSGGRLTVRVYGAGERVPAMEVFEAVSRGAAHMGHGASYYWKGKAPATTFFTTVPFGLTSWEMDGWLYFGGGMKLWRELYAPFNLVPFAAGNTGTQMAGWFRRPINSMADLQDLKMRIPGLGGEVMQRLGVETVAVPGNELFTALSTGVIDAAEWVGPYNDLAFGLFEAAKYYYYPGWHEPNGNLEVIVNAEAWQALPADLQAIVEAACRASGVRVSADFAAHNQRALQVLVEEHGVKLRRLPDEVLAELQVASEAVLRELVASDPFAKRVYDSHHGYRKRAVPYAAIAEQAVLNARAPIENPA